MDESVAPGDAIIRAKWTTDGAQTLSEAAQLLRAYADELEEMERRGFQLLASVQDDYGFVRRGRPP